MLSFVDQGGSGVADFVERCRFRYGR